MDKKFKKFKQITDLSNKRMKQANEEYKQFCKEVNRKNVENKKAADDHIKLVKEAIENKIESGEIPELSNIIASIALKKENSLA